MLSLGFRLNEGWLLNCLGLEWSCYKTRMEKEEVGFWQAEAIWTDLNSPFRKLASFSLVAEVYLLCVHQEPARARELLKLACLVLMEEGL